MESQIAKIELFNARTANNYVFVMAEKAAGSDAELYMVAELPLLNPAAEQACEELCLAVAAGLRRAYKRPLTGGSFESAVSQINEELGKLAAMGQTYWINKFNCILGVKNNAEFTVASCGKTSAYLLRGGEFTDISTANSESHPLKTFDSFATGKIRLGDVLLLSNVQLLNFLSMDRLREILKGANFLAAAQTIIELLKELAGPAVAFGTILNLQVPEGAAAGEGVDLENYIVESSSFKPTLNKVKNWVMALFGLGANARRQPKADLPKISVSERFAKLKGGAGKMLRGAKDGISGFSGSLSSAGRAISPSQIKHFSPVKRVLFGAIIILIIAAVLNISLTIRNKNIKAKSAAVAMKLKTAESDLNTAQSALLYKDEQKARDNLQKAQNDMPSSQEVPKDQEAQYRKLLAQFEDFKKQIEHNEDAQIKELANLAESPKLISLPGYLAVQSGQSIISYDTSTGKVEDGKLKFSGQILAAYGFKPGQAAVYNGEALSVWSYLDASQGQPLISSVPPKERFVGLSYYPTNNRIYLIDKEKKQAISFLINKDKLQNPVTSFTDNSLSQAIDIAIDGNVYVLTSSGIQKFTAGKPAAFTMPFTFEPFSGNGRLYTQVNWQYLYLLDMGKNRILIIDKKGNLVKTLTSAQFTNLKDFAVDETQRIIYLLNGSGLLRVDF